MQISFIFNTFAPELIMENKPIIVLDFGGVLMSHDRPGCLQALRQWMSDDQILNIVGFGNNSHDTMLYRFETGACSAQEFVEQLLALCPIGTTADEVIKAWNKMHAGIADDKWHMVERLHAEGYPLYLMSNTDPLHWQNALRLYPGKMETLFDELFLSFELGLFKPDAVFYEQVHRRINGAGKEVFFVDDTETNRLAAQQSVGWRTFADLEELFSAIDGMS